MASPVPMHDVGVFDVIVQSRCFGFEPGERIRCCTHYPKTGDIVVIRTENILRLARFRGRYLELSNGQRLIGTISQIKGVLTRVSL
jgi:hypothetical protein